LEHGREQPNHLFHYPGKSHKGLPPILTDNLLRCKAYEKKKGKEEGQEYHDRHVQPSFHNMEGHHLWDDVRKPDGHGILSCKEDVDPEGIPCSQYSPSNAQDYDDKEIREAQFSPPIPQGPKGSDLLSLRDDQAIGSDKGNEKDDYRKDRDQRRNKDRKCLQVLF